MIIGTITSKLPKKTKTESSGSRTVDIRGQLHSTPTRTTTRQMVHHRGIYMLGTSYNLYRNIVQVILKTASSQYYQALQIS